MTAKRPYLEALGIRLWLPRRTLAVHPQPLHAPLPVGEEPAGQADDFAMNPEESELVNIHPPTPSHPGEEDSNNPFSCKMPLPLRGSGGEHELLPEPLPPPDDWMLPIDGDWEPVGELDAADGSPLPTLSREAHIAKLDWAELIAEARQCQACGLCTTRTQVVFGVGNRQAEWLVIGEGPGADEDQQGEPFVGRAGKLLNPMLLAIGLQREQAYITNIVRCRPPENREPTPEEAAKCWPFLQRQIALIRPRIILAVGRIAAQNLLGTDLPIGKLRGRVHRFGPLRIPVVVIYHPAYLLRSPREKRKAWDDLRLARRTLAAEAVDANRRSVNP